MNGTFEDETPTPFSPTPDSAHGLAEKPAARRRRIRSLVVEDSADDALLVKEMLAAARNVHFEIDVVSRLSEAASRLIAGGIDVVILDLNLPDSSGPASVVTLQQLASHVPIVVLTGVEDETIVAQVMHAGAQDYVTKGLSNAHWLVRSLRFAVERSRRRRAERALQSLTEQSLAARVVQQRLLPVDSPLVAGFDVFGAVYPAEATSGDCFDYVPLPDGTLAIMIADVSGHGFPSALVMAETRAYVRAFAQVQSDVGQIVRGANVALCRDLRGDGFVTMMIAQLDPRDFTVRYTNAGHPPGFILDSAGGVRARLDACGLPLGMESGGNYPVSDSIRLSPGDLAFLFTDGITESLAADSSLFGMARVLDVVRTQRAGSARDVVEAVHAAARRFAGGTAQLDDITAVALKVKLR
jgi:serine phosphatase RsbU (regulator of sigma subunit)